MARLKAKPDDRTLLVSQAQQHGKIRFYAENELAKKFVELLKQRNSLSPEDVERIKALGYKVLAVPRSFDPVEL